MLYIPGQIDRPHSPMTQFLLDEIPVGYCGLEVGIRHARWTRLDLEQVLELNIEDLEEAVAGFWRGIWVLAIYDLRPVAA